VGGAVAYVTLAHRDVGIDGFGFYLVVGFDGFGERVDIARAGLARPRHMCFFTQISLAGDPWSIPNHSARFAQRLRRRVPASL
jgi:hypothetical protein